MNGVIAVISLCNVNLLQSICIWLVSAVVQSFFEYVALYYGFDLQYLVTKPEFK